MIFCNNSSSYHPGGNIECTQTWAEGLLDGLMWSYRVDGTLEQSQMFVKGLLHGPSILYHTDGATVVRSLQFVHNLQVVAAAAAAAAGRRTHSAHLANLTPTPQDGMCQWFRSDGSRLSAAEYSYGKLHGVQTWYAPVLPALYICNILRRYKADGHSIDYVEKYWNGERARMDVDHATAGGGSARGGKWTELEREQVKVLPREMRLPLPAGCNACSGVRHVTHLHTTHTTPAKQTAVTLCRSCAARPMLMLAPQLASNSSTGPRVCNVHRVSCRVTCDVCCATSISSYEAPDAAAFPSVPKFRA